MYKSRGFCSLIDFSDSPNLRSKVYKLDSSLLIPGSMEKERS